jgi:hypothetical protein
MPVNVDWGGRGRGLLPNLKDRRDTSVCAKFELHTTTHRNVLEAYL